MEQYYITITMYDCPIQEFFWQAVHLLHKSRDDEKDIDTLREAAVKTFLTAYNTANNARANQLSQNLPIPNIIPYGGIPGFRNPNDFDKPRHRGLRNRSSFNPDSTKFDLSGLSKSLLCGDLGHTFDLSRLPGIQLPEFGLPDTSLGTIDLNIDIDSCLGDYLPPIFETKNLGSSFELGGGPMGKIGELAQKAQELMGEAQDLLNKATDSINSAISSVENMANEAISGALDSARGALSNILGNTTSSGFLGSLGSAIKNIKDAIAPIAKAASEAYGLAMGAIGVFNKVRDLMGNDVSDNINSILEARNDIKRALSKLTQGNFTKPDLSISETIRRKLETAQRDAGLAERKLKRVQNLYDRINERQYKIVDGRRVYEHKLPDGTTAYIVLDVNSGDKPLLFCGVPRQNQTESSNIINKLIKGPGIPISTKRTKPRDAQLRGLEYLEAVHATTNAKLRISQIFENGQGCDECTADSHGRPAPTVPPRDNFRDLLINELHEAIQDDLVSKGTPSNIADQLANSRAENHILVKLNDSGLLQPNDYDFDYEDLDDLLRKLTDLIDKQRIDELIPAIIKMPKDTDPKILLEAIGRLLYNINPDCEVDLDYSEPETKPQEQPKTNNTEILPEHKVTLDPVVDNSELWYLIEYKIPTTVGTAKYLVTKYKNKDGDVLAYYYRIIDVHYVIENLDHKFNGLSEKQAQKLMQLLLDKYIDLKIYRNNELISHITWDSLCEMVNDIHNGRVLDLNDGLLTETKIFKATDNGNSYTICSKLDGSCITVDKPTIPEKIDIPLLDTDKIVMGSQICDGIIEYLMNKSVIIKEILAIKGLDSKDFKTWEYVRYVLLPSNKEMYNLAIQLCETGNYEQFDKKRAYIGLGYTEGFKLDKNRVLETESIQKYTFTSKELDIIIPKDIVDRIPGAPAGIQHNNHNLYINVHLTDRVREGFTPATFTRHNTGTEYYVTPIANSDSDYIEVTTGNGAKVYRFPINKVQYERNKKPQVEVL